MTADSHLSEKFGTVNLCATESDDCVSPALKEPRCTLPEHHTDDLSSSNASDPSSPKPPDDTAFGSPFPIPACIPFLPCLEMRLHQQPQSTLGQRLMHEFWRQRQRRRQLNNDCGRDDGVDVPTILSSFGLHGSDALGIAQDEIVQTYYDTPFEDPDFIKSTTVLIMLSQCRASEIGGGGGGGSCGGSHPTTPQKSPRSVQQHTASPPAPRKRKTSP